MPIDEFLACMLFFLPNKHEMSVRYYGIYMRPAKRLKLESHGQKSTWAEAIKSSLGVRYQLTCPICKNTIESKIIYSYQASIK